MDSPMMTTAMSKVVRIAIQTQGSAHIYQTCWKEYIINLRAFTKALGGPFKPPFLMAKYHISSSPTSWSQSLSSRTKAFANDGEDDCGMQGSCGNCGAKL
jgi:hypothetical protein